MSNILGAVAVFILRTFINSLKGEGALGSIIK